MAEMQRVIDGEVVQAYYGAGQWPWETYVNQLAIDRKDVSLVPGIGAAKRNDLIEAGFDDVQAIAASAVESLTEIRGIGEKMASKLITSANALVLERPIPRGKAPELPKSKNQVFLDLEGTDSRIGAEGLDVVNYLIGGVIRGPFDQAEYKAFFAETLSDEEKVLREFLEWAASLEDPVFYHWHNYERTHLVKMSNFYGIDGTLQSEVTSRLVDLQAITTAAFAFPTYGEGLKDIAKCLDFRWRHADVSALSSVVLYLGYVASGAQTRRPNLRS